MSLLAAPVWCRDPFFAGPLGVLVVVSASLAVRRTFVVIYMTTPAIHENRTSVVADRNSFCDPNGFGGDAHAETWERLSATSGTSPSSLGSLTMPVGDFKLHVTDYPDTMAAVKA